MKVHCHIEGDEESVKAYAMIDASNEAWARIYASHAPMLREKIMSVETVREQRKKILELATNMRVREMSLTRELSDG